MVIFSCFDWPSNSQQQFIMENCTFLHEFAQGGLGHHNQSRKRKYSKRKGLKWIHINFPARRIFISDLIIHTVNLQALFWKPVTSSNAACTVFENTDRPFKGKKTFENLPVNFNKPQPSFQVFNGFSGNPEKNSDAEQINVYFQFSLLAVLTPKALLGCTN